MKASSFTTSFKIIGLILISVLILGLLQALVMPKYMHGITEGAMISEYYGESMNHDVVFIGDCEVYENFSPVVMWEEYGINSVIRGSAQQLMWQSYYLMEETLRYEKPKAIVFNVLAMQYDEPQNEAYNRMTLDGMRWSDIKVKDIEASMTDEEHLIEYVFPILRFHGRITELDFDDIKYIFRRNPVSFKGYYMRTDIKAAEDVPVGRPLADYAFSDIDYEYLDKMRLLCEENGVELILIKAPSLYPYWYDEWDEQIEDYANAHDLCYYNFLHDTDEIGLDYSTDTYDAGLHLNLSGTTKLSDYFGRILINEHDIPDRSGDEMLRESWQTVITRYYEAAGQDSSEDII